MNEQEYVKRQLLSRDGFCKRLSMKGLRAESLVWKLIKDLGLQLTQNFPKDKNGENSWEPVWCLNEVRCRCIRILYSEEQDDLEREFCSLASSFRFMVKIQGAHLFSVQIVLTWVALELMKVPPSHVKKFREGIKRLLNRERFNKFLSEHEQCFFTPEEQKEYRILYEWMYTVVGELQSSIKQCKDQNLLLKIKPELGSPQKILGSWMEATNCFDLSRIGVLLTLWKSTNERIAVLKHIKNECGASRVLDREECIQKLASIDELITALKANDGIALLCRLQDLNMRNSKELENLHDGIEQIRAENTSRNTEIEEKEKTIQMQAGYIAYLESCDYKKKKENKVKDFRQCVTFPEDAECLIQRLHELIDIQTSPKEIFMPVRAAMDAGVIRRPTWDEFCAEFGCDKVNSKSSLYDFTKKDYKYTDEAFNLLVKEFSDYRNRF